MKIATDISSLLQAQEERDRFFALSLDMLGIANMDGYFTDVNPAFEHTLGFTADELCAEPFFNLVHPDDVSSTMAEVMKLASGATTIAFENRYRCKDGSYRSILWTAVPTPDLQRIYAAGIDITDRKRVEEALRTSEERFRGIFDQSTIGMALTTPDGRLLDVNQALCRILGYIELELLDLRNAVLTHPDDVAESRERMRQLLAGDIRSTSMEKRYLHKQGHVIWTLYTASLLRTVEGQPLNFIYQLQDITARKAAEAALLKSEAQFRATFEQAAVGIAHLDAEGRWLRLNDRFCQILGYAREELLEQSLQEITYIGDRDEQFHAVQRLLAGKLGVHTRELRFVGKDQSPIWVQVTVSAVSEIRGEPPYLVAVVEDISERKAAQVQLAHLAQHDALTGLPNRLAFRDNIERCLKAAIERHDFLAVLLIDLDGFKAVNDMFGHEAGDTLLCEIGVRLIDSLYTSDMVARLGGDEFAVVLPMTDELGAVAVAQKLLARLAAPVTVAGGLCAVTGSIGIAAYPAHGSEHGTLLQHADAAMYKAKAIGGGYLVYGKELG